MNFRKQNLVSAGRDGICRNLSGFVCQNLRLILHPACSVFLNFCMNIKVFERKHIVAFSQNLFNFHNLSLIVCCKYQFFSHLFHSLCKNFGQISTLIRLVYMLSGKSASPFDIFFLFLLILCRSSRWLDPHILVKISFHHTVIDLAVLVRLFANHFLGFLITAQQEK